jgi:hypothetical protein
MIINELEVTALNPPLPEPWGVNVNVYGPAGPVITKLVNVATPAVTTAEPPEMVAPDEPDAIDTER